MRAQFRNRYILGSQIVTFLLVLGWSIRPADENPLPVLVMVMIGAIGLLVFALLVVAGAFVLSLLLTFGNQSGILCEHEIEIKEEGLADRTEVSEGLHRWAGFHKVSRAENALYLFVNESYMHIIPSRVFATPEEMEAFGSEIERRMAEAKQRAN